MFRRLKLIILGREKVFHKLRSQKKDTKCLVQMKEMGRCKRWGEYNGNLQTRSPVGNHCCIVGQNFLKLYSCWPRFGGVVLEHRKNNDTMCVSAVQTSRILCITLQAPTKPKITEKRTNLHCSLRNRTTPKVWMPYGFKSAGCCRKDFLEMLVALKNWKMPNHANTWSSQTAVMKWKKIWKNPTTKETWPKDDASSKFPVETCPPVKSNAAEEWWNWPQSLG